MKTIELSVQIPSLAEIIELAEEDTIIIRTTDGKEFVLAEIDDFAREVSLVRQNKELMELLDARSKETKTYTLSQVRNKINSQE